MIQLTKTCHFKLPVSEAEWIISYAPVYKWYIKIVLLTSSRSEKMEKIKDKHLSNKRHTIFFMAISFLFSQLHLSTSFSCAHIPHRAHIPHHAHPEHTHTEATRSPSSLWQQQLIAAWVPLHWLSSSTALFILTLKQRIPV